MLRDAVVLMPPGREVGTAIPAGPRRRGVGRMGRTSTGETELEMMRRHVAQGARAIERQRGRVKEMRAAGHDTARAEEILHQFEQTQRMHSDHLRRLMDGPED